MTKKDLSKEVLKKIKDKDLKPAPRWKFLLKKSFLWGALYFSLLIGGIATSIIIFMLLTNDWDVYRSVDSSFLEFLLKTMPYFWIGIFALFIFIAYYNFKKTSKGYKYKFSIIAAASIAVCLIVGGLLFSFGLAKRIENSILNTVPYYHQLSDTPRMKMWSQPEKGLLGGKIIKPPKKDLIEIMDFENKKWEVIPPEEMKKPLKKDMLIQAIGEKLDEGTFKAQNIRPWERNLRETIKKKLIFLKENGGMPRNR